ncbi:hypothetical protein GWG65_26175 [Bradyrhizobium sp. CSA207]|uniref:hypothetical protein n=1 Tax=Bradyrhizobium sp. CSA207 TaxID=2698826 RepID=UPI0023AF784A|nr:hypothetical protein [Bradyrhizobium sp. CSA207]MDE5444873.1 hypothetical protein [Bradyrhizobium sp. CSA207]
MDKGRRRACGCAGVDWTRDSCPGGHRDEVLSRVVETSPEEIADLDKEGPFGRPRN